LTDVLEALSASKQEKGRIFALGCFSKWNILFVHTFFPPKTPLYTFWEILVPNFQNRKFPLQEEILFELTIYFLGCVVWGNRMRWTDEWLLYIELENW
jgi:hypothetical protein